MVNRAYRFVSVNEIDREQLLELAKEHEAGSDHRV